MVTTKVSFLRRLRFSLSWNLPPSEVQDIVADYDGFFSSGLAEGRTEEELCRQFGPPGRVARSILSEEPGQSGLRCLLIAAWPALAAVLTSAPLSGAVRGLKVPYLTALLLVPLLCLLWRKRLSSMPSLSCSEKQQLLLLHGLPAVLWLAIIGFSVWMMAVTLGGARIPFGLQPGQIGGVCNGVLCLGSWLLTFLMLLCLAAAWMGAPRCLTAAAQCVGALASVGLVLQELHSMNIRAIWNPFIDTFLPALTAYILGWGGVLLTALILLRGGRHGRAA